MRKIVVFFLVLAVFSILSARSTNSPDLKACEYARSKKSLETWNEYLESFPNGECAFEAKQQIKKLKEEIVEAISQAVVAKEAEYIRKGRKIGNLIWSDRSSNKMNWNNAKQYCEDLTENGFMGWRLPNIDELRTLIQNHSGTQTGGTCQISEKAGKLSVRDRTEDCKGRGSDGINFSRLGEGDGKGRIAWFWSSSTLSDIPDVAWGVSFYYGFVGDFNKSLNGGFVRCVRNAE